jgi:putative acetyltransferase
MAKTSRPDGAERGHTDGGQVSFEISRARVDEPDVAELIRRHIDLMSSQSAEDACHVMMPEALAASGIDLLVLRECDRAMAIGALRHADTFCELKCMHTAVEARGRGMVRAMVRALVALARDAGMTHVSLETGSGPEHEAARALYASEGFRDCPPFGDYSAHPLSVFMRRRI